MSLTFKRLHAVFFASIRTLKVTNDESETNFCHCGTGFWISIFGNTRSGRS